MTDQDKYPTTPSRDTEEILSNYNSDTKKMRAKAARERIEARRKAEQDERQRAAIEKIPPEHRYMPDQAS